jgi:hypothetical protein
VRNRRFDDPQEGGYSRKEQARSDCTLSPRRSPPLQSERAPIFTTFEEQNRVKKVSQIRSVDLSNSDEVLDYLEWLEERFTNVVDRLRKLERVVIEELDLEMPDVEE